LGFWALVVFTVAMVSGPHQYFPILAQLRLVFVAGAVAVGAHLFTVFRGTRAGRIPLEVKVGFALVLCAAISVPTSVWPGYSVDVLFDRFLKSVTIFWLLGTLVSSVRRLRVFLWVLTATVVPMALTALAAFFSGEILHGRIVLEGTRGIGSANPNDLALWISLVLPLTATLAMSTSRTGLRIVLAGIAALGIAGVVVTFSRAGVLTLALEAALFGLVLWRNRRVGGVLLVVVLAVVVASFVPEEFLGRFSTAVGTEQDESAFVRWRDSVAAAQYILTHPIIGAGLGCDALVLNEMRGNTWTGVHNVYLAYGVDLGMVGLVLFVTLVVACYRSARKAASEVVRDATLRKLANGVRISLAGFILAGFFFTVQYHFHFYYLAGLAVAVKLAGQREALRQV
jgi:O-antigen ligase